MEELATSADIYPPRTSQAWRTLLNWISLLFQIFVQIIRGAPSVLSYVGLRHTNLLSSSSLQFKQLPVVELQEPDEASTFCSSIRISSGPVSDDQSLEKLTVVLDLDETLVCAYETSTVPATLRKKAIEAGLNCFDLECISSEKESEGEPKVNYVTVFERPGLHDFLKQLSEFADLVLFTAGLEGYARPLVDRIDVENLFRLRLYRPSTISTEYREHVKDLSCISKHMCRIVIVDNNPFSFLLQPLNGIPCVPFSAGQPHDQQVPSTSPISNGCHFISSTFLLFVFVFVFCDTTIMNLTFFFPKLLEVILPFLKQLSQQKDIRPFMYESFHMPEWFQKHGIPTT